MSALSRRSRLSGAALASMLLLAIAAPAAVVAADRAVNCRTDPGALRPAIAAAAPGDTLRVSGTCHGQFSIGKDLTITGVGRATIDGGESTIAVGVNFDPVTGPITFPAPTVRLIGVTVTGGTEAAIVNFGQAELRDVTVRDSAGDGVFTHAGSVVLNRSLVRDNAGDGIQSMSVVELYDSTVRDNGGDGVVGGLGITVVRSTIADNAGRGLASYDQTGVGVERSTIRNNRDGGIAVGGNSALVVSDSRITGNTSTTNGGGISAAGARLVAVRISRSVISGNTAAGDGGGIYTGGTDAEDDWIEETTIRGNTAGGRGGGIFNGMDPWAESYGYVYVLTLRGSTITRNLAGVAGGGIFNDASVALEGTRLTRNAPDDCVGC